MEGNRSPSTFREESPLTFEFGELARSSASSVSETEPFPSPFWKLTVIGAGVGEGVGDWLGDGRGYHYGAGLIGTAPMAQ